MRKAPALEDEIAERVLTGLERVKLNDVADAGLKLGIEASCVLGVKAVLDMLPLEGEGGLLPWVKAHPEAAKSLMGSFALLQITGSPLALAPLFKNILEDEDTRAKLMDLILEHGLMTTYAIAQLQGPTVLSPVILAMTILSRQEDVQVIFDESYVKVETAQAELNAVRIEYAEKVKRVAEIISLMQQISESYDKEEHKIDLLMELEDELRALRYVLPVMESRIRVLEAKVAEGQTVSLKAEEALDRSATLMKWAIAFVVGTYAAGSLIYAQDTIFDVVKEALGMFKIIPPVV